MSSAGAVLDKAKKISESCATEDHYNMFMKWLELAIYSEYLVDDTMNKGAVYEAYLFKLRDETYDRIYRGK